jgi:hypothetical protein
VVFTVFPYKKKGEQSVDLEAINLREEKAALEPNTREHSLQSGRPAKCTDTNFRRTYSQAMNTE